MTRRRLGRSSVSKPTSLSCCAWAKSNGPRGRTCSPNCGSCTSGAARRPPAGAHRTGPRPVPAGAGVVVAGLQPEAVKWGALAGCEFLISPSAWESFSLVVLEGWLAGKAVLVNGRCEPTVEHCVRSGGGLWFDQYGDFEVAVDRLRADGSCRDQLAANGAEYTRRLFSWPVITARYAEVAARIATTWPAPAGR